MQLYLVRRRSMQLPQQRWGRRWWQGYPCRRAAVL